MAFFNQFMTLSSDVKAVELVKYLLKLLQYSNIALKTFFMELRAPQKYPISLAYEPSFFNFQKLGKCLICMKLSILTSCPMNPSGLDWPQTPPQ